MAGFNRSQPLSDFNVLETQDVDEARATMTSLYGDLTLTPLSQSASFALRLNAAPVGRLLISSMRWEAPIEAHSPALDGCFDFCVALYGAAETRIGRRTINFVGSHGGVLSPTHPMHCRNAGALIALNVKVPSALAEAQVRALTGNEIGEPLDFDPHMAMQREVAGTWRLLRHLVAELERNPSLLGNPLVMERYADTLLTSFITSQPNNYSPRLRREAQPAEPRYVRLIEEYLEAHCNQPITARDLAEVAGVSVSALYAGFKRHRGCAPLKFLEEIRLHRVRDALLMGLPGTTVKEVGLRWGFNSPSGLSRAYGRRFGETPSETLRRAAKRQ